MFFEAKDVIESSLLHRAFGDEVVLYDEDNKSTTYRILREFRLGDQIYAVLHSPKLPKEVEYVIFRVINELDEVSLETIDDDDEWEAVAEVYDEITYTIQE